MQGVYESMKKLEEGKELLGMSAILAVPTYGPPDPQCQKDIRLNMMVAANHGLKWAGDASPDRMGWSAARNNVAQMMLEAGPSLADGIMWVDSDIRMGPGAMVNLLAAARAHEAEFVTGVYYQREGAHNPVIYHYNRKKRSFQPAEEFPEHVFAPIDGCGFGFVWTSWKLIDAIARHKDFDPKEGWFPDNRDAGGFGEDLSMCAKAMACKIQLYVDTGINLGHVGSPNVIYRENFLEERKKLTEEEKKEKHLFGIKENTNEVEGQ